MTPAGSVADNHGSIPPPEGSHSLIPALDAPSFGNTPPAPLAPANEPVGPGRAVDAGTPRAEAWVRRFFAFFFSAVGVAGVFHILTKAQLAIDTLTRDAATSTTAIDRTLIIAGLVVHGVVSLAAIYFAYSAIKGAERMVVPERLYDAYRQDAADLIRALTGFEAPTEALSNTVVKRLKEVVSGVNELLQSTSDVVKNAVVLLRNTGEATKSVAEMLPGSPLPGGSSTHAGPNPNPPTTTTTTTTSTTTPRGSTAPSASVPPAAPPKK